jgi:hypothetical protein
MTSVLLCAAIPMATEVSLMQMVVKIALEVNIKEDRVKGNEILGEVGKADVVQVGQTA